MSDTLKLALTITAVDMFSGVLRRLQGRIRGTGAEAQRVRRDFELMTRSIGQGVKALAGAGYVAAKLRPGVQAASDLQGAMLNVKQLLWTSGEGADRLNQRLAQVRRTAVQVSANLPYSATDLVNVEANLLQGGVSRDAVIGKRGAAFATAALSAFGKMAPETVSESIAKIGHAFQLNGKEYEQAADTLARVSSSSAADLGELLYNLKRAGPAAHALNISLKDTTIALAAVSSLGDEAGSDLNQFFNGLTASTPVARRALKALGVSFFDMKGNFIGMWPALDRLRAALDKVPSQQKRLIYLNRIFQTQGTYAAKLLLQTGNKSAEDILRNSDAAAGLIQRRDIWGEGFGASVQKLTGTGNSTLANLFDPLLGPLSKVVNKLNELVSAIGDEAEKHRAIAQTISYGGAGLVGAGVLFGGYKMLRGGLAGMRVLKGLKGLGGAAGGIAAGKAVEAATGVAPVFVTNWPAGFGSGSGGAIEKATEVAKKAAVAASGGVAVPAIAAGLAGGGLIYGAYKLTHNAGARAYDQAQQEAVDSARAKMAREIELKKKGIYAPRSGMYLLKRIEAFFGDKDAKAALAASDRAYRTHPQELNGTIKLEVTSKDAAVRVKGAKMDRPGVHVQTDTALSGVGAW